MRWWMHTDPPFIMSVDNSSTAGMDFAALPANTWMVQWIDGRGEIEYQTEDGANLNGLRQSFTDIIPYVGYFQQFLTLMVEKDLLLPQAKVIQNELIGEIFESKRQQPFAYIVAAGAYSWDATDATLFSSYIVTLQNLTAKANELVAALNAIFPTLISQINAGLGVSVAWPVTSNVATTNVSWIPVGQSASVTVTQAEQFAILQGITNRTNNLQAVKTSKQTAVNALATIPAVIAYDVTAGW